MQKYLFSKIMLLALATSALSVNAATETANVSKPSKKDYAYLITAGIIAGAASNATHNLVNIQGDCVLAERTLFTMAGLATGAVSIQAIKALDEDALQMHDEKYYTDVATFWAAYIAMVLARSL